ncbi:hypothetical protein ABZ260_39930, partial [Streptosporangium sp. NPDC006013]|uniref:hypothetical protein n=1 Tax=Streptosporangium sp. NPDC006013 TaxID=3155596 RepID=UPI0033B6792E
SASEWSGWASASGSPRASPTISTIESIEFDETGLPPEIDRAVPVVAPGATVSPPPKGTLWGRIAYATALSETVEECRAALDAAEAVLKVRATA